MAVNMGSCSIYFKCQYSLAQPATVKPMTNQKDIHCTQPVESQCSTVLPGKEICLYPNITFDKGDNLKLTMSISVKKYQRIEKDQPQEGQGFVV
jgi:hypothetical protein